MNFGCAFTRIIQAIWEADPAEGPVRVSTINLTYSYHRSTLQPSQVGALTYVVKSGQDNDCIKNFIDMVLPMG